MENISLKIQAYLDKEFNDDEVKLQDDGSGVYISFWSDSLAKSKPSNPFQDLAFFKSFLKL